MKSKSLPVLPDKTANASEPDLQFHGITPTAIQGLGGLPRDQFANGRLSASIGTHGGLLDIAYWGTQHLGAAKFFQGDAGTAWVKLFRLCSRIGESRHYFTLNHTKLYPFGLTSRCGIESVQFQHDLLLLPDALVQRFCVLQNPERLPIHAEMLHQEAITAAVRQNREWADFAFHPGLNALIASCTDENPVIYDGRDALAQKDLGMAVKDSPLATTWIGLGCDIPMTARRGYHPRSKHYLESEAIPADRAAFFLVFATSRRKLEQRLKALSKQGHEECGELLNGYEKRLSSRPRIETGSPVLNSAFSQYPEIIHHLKVPDQKGAVRASASSYFVWGWDGMTPMHSSALANEPEYTADILRFFRKTRHPRIGLPHQFTTTFKPKLRAPFPAQVQYITGLYHYVSTTGDLSVAREVWPVCRFLFERCRRDEVKETGLVSGNALWPDFPEAMEENGNDVSSMNNSLLYQGLRCAEYLAAALGDAVFSRECASWARRLRESFRKYLYDEEKGYFVSSCSSKNLKPRKHYCCQAIYWLTPFARELVSHAPGRIASFMDEHLRSKKCLLSLPHWDAAWMADGNQLGSSFPAADSFYLNVHKLVGNDFGIKAWLGDVEWFWRRHTTPEAFTPEAENEHAFGPDSPGGKQLQSCTTWYYSLYNGLAGLDFDHEGLTITPWGEMPLEIRGLRLRGTVLNLKLSGSGTQIGALTLNGKQWPGRLRKIPWSVFKGKTTELEILRSESHLPHPVIVRADGLRVTLRKSRESQLKARIEGTMHGEVVIQTPEKARALVNGKQLQYCRDSVTGTLSIPFFNQGEMELDIVQ